jgi:hypothetical protein
MSLKPAHRYASAKAPADDVERWMANEPVTAWREPWTRALSRCLGRHGVGVTAVAAARTYLHQAAAAGYRDAKWLRADPDLGAIRSRPDFRIVAADMGFANDAFAPQ